MNTPEPEHDAEIARMQRMYGHDFYDLSYNDQRLRIRALDKQYDQSTSFIDDLRLSDWVRKYDKAFGAH